MQALSLLIKPVSGSCNMRCQYCFYADVAAAREMPNRGMMRISTLEHIVRRAFEEAEEFVSFGFQGGEPMLAGRPYYQALINLAEKHNPRGVPAAYSIQTNGTLIDAEWAGFFAENNFLVGLSIDGDKRVHNLLRPNAAGDTTHRACLNAADMLARAGADFNVLSVVSKQFAAHPDAAWRFYKDNGFRFIQLIACLDGLGQEHGDNPFSLDADSYGRFLCRFFDLWYADFIQGDYLSVRAFDNWVRMLMGQQPENCGMLGHCQAYPVIEADGSVYPCDFYVLDAYKLGDVAVDTFASMLAGEAAQRFEAPGKVIRDECLGCEYYVICRGGCRRDREPLQEGAPSLNVHCAAYKQFFAHALPRMTDIAARMRP
ncbi:MAG: anaerobic sulfatase maturase [Ruminococcaceae bacterium]|nr:anaerobic sulfatase maturase [Oscillospiraceae bacterium]